MATYGLQQNDLYLICSTFVGDNVPLERIALSVTLKTHNVQCKSQQSD